MRGNHLAPRRPFPTTRWSMVERAGRKGGQGRRQALSKLLERYLPALRAHLVLGRGLEADRAEDLLQSFVAEKVLERELIGHADRARGRFRTFLLASLDNYLISRLRERNARKRTCVRATPIDVRAHPDLVPTARGPSEEFELAWAREVLAEAVRRFRAECERRGRPDLWGVFRHRVLDPTLSGAEPVPYAELVERLGFTSPSQGSNALVTAKRIFRRSLKSVAGEYSADEEEAEAEIRELRAILSRAGAR